MNGPVQPRNRSLRYSDHTGLLHKWAVKFHARLTAASLGVEFDDVMGELSLAFVKATQGYKPERGFSFTAFLQQCCQHHFNKYADRLMLEQFGCSHADDADEHVGKRGLGCVSIHSMGSDEFGSEDFYATVESDTYATPEEVQEARMSVRNLINDQTLFPETRAYLAKLANPDVSIPPAAAKRIQARGKEVRQQIRERWGIQLHTMSL